MDQTVKAALETYRSKISILKKGYAQERFRIEQIARSVLGALSVREVRSVDIASYRDARLETINPKTLKPISPATVRLEMSLLSSFSTLRASNGGFATETLFLMFASPRALRGAIADSPHVKSA